MSLFVCLYSSTVWRAVEGIWFGGKKTANGPWKWEGKSTGVIHFVLWDNNEPSGPATEDCMGTWLNTKRGYTGRTHSVPCSWTANFVCEKVFQSSL